MKALKIEVDTDWVQKRLSTLSLTHRDAASDLEIDAASFNHLVNGKRKLSLELLAPVAKLLETPVAEVSKRFGTDLGISSGGVPERKVALSGIINEKLEVEWGVVKGPSTVSCTFPDMGLKALRCHTVGSRFFGWNGACLFFREPAGGNEAVMECIGRLSLVVLKDSKTTLLRVVERGFSKGHYNLAFPSGESAEEDVEISRSAMVEWSRWS